MAQASAAANPAAVPAPARVGVYMGASTSAVTGVSTAELKAELIECSREQKVFCAVEIGESSGNKLTVGQHHYTLLSLHCVVLLPPGPAVQVGPGSALARLLQRRASGRVLDKQVLSAASACVSSQQARHISVTATVPDSNLKLQQLLRSTMQPDSTQVPLVVVTQHYLARSTRGQITSKTQQERVDWVPVQHEGGWGAAAMQLRSAQEGAAASRALQQLVQQLEAQVGNLQHQQWQTASLEDVWVKMLAGVVRWVTDTATSCGCGVAVEPNSKLMQIPVPTSRKEQLQCESSVTGKLRGVKLRPSQPIVLLVVAAVAAAGSCWQLWQ